MTKLGTTGNDTINAGSGADTVVGFEGNDLITGGSFSDWLLGNQNNDTIYGGDGDDTVVGGMDSDLLFGQLGADFMYGNEANDTLSAGMGNDTVIGGKGDDAVYGDEGADLVYGNEGNDTISGGAGIDTVGYVSNSLTVRAVSGGYQVTDNTGIEGVDLVSDVEYLETGDGAIHAIADLVEPTPTPAPFVPSTTFQFNERLPVADRNGSGNFDNGDGTTPSTGFQGVTNADTHVHIYASEQYRQTIPPLVPVSSTSDGVTMVNRYNVNAGTQSIANGSPSNRTDRAASNRNTDVGVDSGTLADFINGGGTITAVIDEDPTAAVHGTTLTARVDTVNGTLDWYNGNTAWVTDDAGSPTHSGNSWNALFDPNIHASDLSAGAQFTDTISARSAGGALVAALVMDVHLV